MVVVAIAGAVYLVLAGKVLDAAAVAVALVIIVFLKSTSPGSAREWKEFQARERSATRNTGPLAKVGVRVHRARRAPEMPPIATNSHRSPAPAVREPEVNPGVDPVSPVGDRLVMRRSLDGDEHQGDEVPPSAPTADRVRAACPIDRPTAGTYGHSRTA